MILKEIIPVCLNLCVAVTHLDQIIVMGAVVNENKYSDNFVKIVLIFEIKQSRFCGFMETLCPSLSRPEGDCNTQ